MRRCYLGAALAGVLLVPGVLSAAAAGSLQPEAYVKNCLGIRPTLPIGTTQGTEGDDVIVGTARDDVIYGNGGNDLICGRYGSDTIFGGPGEDRLVGGDGEDVLDGGPGRDTLMGLDGCDSLYGGNGNDVLMPGSGSPSGLPGTCTGIVAGGAGADRVVIRASSLPELDGGPGLDMLDFHLVIGNVTIDLAAGTFAGHLGTTPLSGVAVDFERARGTKGNDTIFGTDGPNRLAGMHGGDVIWGRGGEDFLNGGPDWAWDAPDTLHGGEGFDICVEGETVTDCEA